MARNRNTPTARTRANAGRPGAGSGATPRPGKANRTSSAGGGNNPSAKSGTRPKSSAARAARTNATRGRTQNPGQPLSTSSMRRRLERASAPVLLRLNRAPRWAPTGAMLVLLLIGLFTPGPVSAALLALVALMLGWLLALAWPTLTAQGRFARVLVIGLVLFSALVRLSGLNVVRKH